MSCELSHMRFSSAIKNDLKVVDNNKYFQGVTYPDSRVVTKVIRNFTHNIKYTKTEFFESDDFKKGWASHVIYDIVHNNVMEEMFYELFKKEDSINNGYSSTIRLAIKILHDLEDAKKFDFSQYLPLINYDFSPQGESINMLNRYNDILYESYKNSMNLTVEDYKKSLKKFDNKRNESADIIVKKVIDLQKSKDIQDKIENIYKISLEVYKKDFLL